MLGVLSKKAEILGIKKAEKSGKIMPVFSAGPLLFFSYVVIYYLWKVREG